MVDGQTLFSLIAVAVWAAATTAILISVRNTTRRLRWLNCLSLFSSGRLSTGAAQGIREILECAGAVRVVVTETPGMVTVVWSRGPNKDDAHELIQAFWARPTGCVIGLRKRGWLEK